MTFRDELMYTVQRWKEVPIKDEWLFEHFRAKAIGGMTSEAAFVAIGEAAEVLANERDEAAAIEILQTMINLARRSNTTEINPRLQLLALKNQFQGYGDYANSKLVEFLGLYRL